MTRARGLDPRLPLLAVAAWAACLVVRLAPALVPGLVLTLVLVGALALVRLRPGPRARRMALASAVVALAAGLVTWGHLERARDNPVAELASQSAVVTAEANVTGDPRTIHGAYGDQVLVPAQLTAVTGRGSSSSLRAPVLLMTDDWPSALQLGARIRLVGRLLRSGDPGLSALVRVSGRPAEVAAPDVWWRGATAVRRAMVDSVAHGPEEVERNFRARARRLGLAEVVLQLPFLPHWRIPEFLRGCLAVCCLEQDFPIWENKLYRERPLLCDADGPIHKFRRWAAQFYQSAA